MKTIFRLIEVVCVTILLSCITSCRTLRPNIFVEKNITIQSGPAKIITKTFPAAQPNNELKLNPTSITHDFYDKKGRWIKSFNIDKNLNDTLLTTYIGYNYSGQKDLFKMLDNQRNLITEELYKYNKNKQLIRVTTHHVLSAEPSEIHYQYIGDTIIVDKIKNGENQCNKYKVMYNSQNQLVETITLGYNGVKAYSTFYKYDSDGNVASSILINYIKEIQNHSNWEYDKYGNVTSEEFLKINKGQTSVSKNSSYNYLYDKYGNVIRREEYDDGKYVGLEISEIIYGKN